MTEPKMIKKCSITCSVILALMIVFQLAFGITITRKRPQNNRHNFSLTAFKNDAQGEYNFADEALPMGDKKVRIKLRHSLRSHNFRHVQTDVLQRKAEKWFPIVEPILQYYGIPDDFKYIPLVEAGFGEGKSRRGAYGPWQFMPGTARTYGLRVNGRHDERLDMRKATIAACKYLQDLHCEFKSWAMVAAAYNTGSPNLMHLVRHQKQGNYFKMHMNRETGSYVYSLIAMKEIISHPEVYGYPYVKPMYAMLYPPKGDLLAFN